MEISIISQQIARNMSGCETIRKARQKLIRCFSLKATFAAKKLSVFFRQKNRKENDPKSRDSKDEKCERERQ